MKIIIESYLYTALWMLIGICVIPSCSNDDNSFVFSDDDMDNTRKEISLSRVEQELVNQCNDFAFRLLQTTNENVDKEQIVLSPLSTSFALAMVANGAIGLTQQEIIEALGFTGFSIDEMNNYSQKILKELGNLDKTSTVNIANSIWLNKDFSPLSSYKKVIEEYYEAEVKTVDFNSDKTLNQINKWCSDKTDGCIPSLLNGLDPTMQMMLINTLYFKGSWENSFNQEDTYRGTFTTSSGSQQVDFMTSTHYYSYMMNENMTVLEIPYGNKAFTMNVLLPREGYSIDECLSELNNSQWLLLQDNRTSGKIEIHLPKLKIEWKNELAFILELLGVKRAFTETADFSGLSKNPMSISSVHQTNYFSVDEKGTEAASATRIEMIGDVIGGVNPKIICVNRPFLFILQEKSTGSILYIGKVEKL